MVQRAKRFKIEKLRDLLPLLHELYFRKIYTGDFLKKTIILFFALVVVSLILSNLLVAAGVTDLENVAESVLRIRAQAPLLLLYLLTVRPIAEEVFFRSFLVPRIGIWGSTILFAAVHVFYFSVAELIGAFILGLILAKAFQHNKNIFPNIFAHIFYNFLAIALLVV